jgi:hypothetical protein
MTPLKATTHRTSETLSMFDLMIRSIEEKGEPDSVVIINLSLSDTILCYIGGSIYTG